MGKYSLVADADRLNAIKSKLSEYSTNISTIITEIFEIIAEPESNKGLNASWTGASYKAFYEGTIKYKSALEEMVNMMDSFIEMISKFAKETGELSEEISEICKLND